nr:ABC transporter permease subunit [Lachnospiraceae bacterium]
MGDLSPLRISLEIALISTILTFITGVTMAYRIGRLGRGKNIIDSLLSLPLVLPPTVTGFLLLLLFGKNSPVGRFLAEIGISVIFTFPGAVIAAFVTSFPIMYRTARGAFELVDTELIDAAKTLGYGNRGILFKVVLPLSWPALSSGAVLSFA